MTGAFDTLKHYGSTAQHPQIDSLGAADQLLLAACRAGAPPPPQRVQQLASEVSDWEACLHDAAVNRVLVGLARTLQPATNVPPHVHAQLFGAIAQLGQRIHQLRSGFEALLPSLAQHCGEFIALRAIDYYYGMFREGLSRPASDIDILIRHAPFSVAGQMRDHYPLPAALRAALPEAIDLELHGDLSVYTAYGLRSARFDMDALWARAQPFEVRGQRVLRLDPVDNFLYLSHHNITKGFIKLYRYNDLGALYAWARPDTHQLLERAHAYGVSTPLWLNLWVVQQLQGTSFPAELMQGCAPPAWLQDAILARWDWSSVLRNPDPDAPGGPQSGEGNAVRMALTALCLARPDNLHKVLMAPASRVLHRWHYELMQHPAWGPRVRQWLGTDGGQELGRHR